MKYSIFITLIILFTACQDNANQKESEGTTNKDTSENVTSGKKTKKQLRDYEITKEGIYRKYYPNGNIRIEGKLNDKKQKDGIWRSYRKNGEIWSKNTFKNNVKDGSSVTYHKNGNKNYEGEYDKGKKTGTWKFYDQKGELIQKKNFEN